MRFTGWTALSLAVLLLGLGLWIYLGSMNGGAYFDPGVYSVGIVLVGLGLVGTLVSAKRAPPA